MASPVNFVRSPCVSSRTAPAESLNRFDEVIAGVDADVWHRTVNLVLTRMLQSHNKNLVRAMCILEWKIVNGDLLCVGLRLTISFFFNIYRDGEPLCLDADCYRQCVKNPLCILSADQSDEKHLHTWEAAVPFSPAANLPTC